MRIIAGLVGLFAAFVAGAAVFAASRKREIVPLEDEDANEVRLVAIFSPVAFHSTASTFRGGTLDCWFGGGIIDLRDATLDPAGAHLEVQTVFGGAQLVVPRDWRVELSVNGLGGARDVRPAREYDATAPLLTVSGFVAFGGLAVASDVPKEALAEVTKAMEQARRKEGIGRGEAASSIEDGRPINGAAPADAAAEASAPG